MVKGGGDYMFPISYTSPLEEHTNTRNNLGMQDLSTMGEVDIKGPGAERLINRLIVNDIRDMHPEKPALFGPENFPVFNVLVPEGRYFGFPVHSVPGFKFGKYHHLEEYVNPDVYEREPNVDDEEILREFASRYFPSGAGPTMTLKACLFTNTPDKHFIIDLHPEYPQVSYAAGFSGHGYKFASVIGEIMADLAERQETRHDISLFSIERLTGMVSDLYRDRPGRGATRMQRGRVRPILPSRRAFQATRQLPSRRPRLHRPLTSRRWRRRVALRHPRRPPQRVSRAQYDYLDSTDPRYWSQEDIQPFWL